MKALDDCAARTLLELKRMFLYRAMRIPACIYYQFLHILLVSVTPPLFRKQLEWTGAAYDELMDLPVAVRQALGYALHFAKGGVKHDHAKPLKGFKVPAYWKLSTILTATHTAPSTR